MEKELNEREADRRLHSQYKDMLEDPHLNLNKMHKGDMAYADKRLSKLVA